jgi:hypothetical protein
LRRFFYEEIQKPRIIEKTSWFLGFLIELFWLLLDPAASLRLVFHLEIRVHPWLMIIKAARAAFAVRALNCLRPAAV